MSFLSDLARAGFVLPTVAALCPHGGDRPVRAAGIACAPGHSLAGTGGGHRWLGGGKANLADVREDAYEAELVARPQPWCSECEDERVWHPESDIGYACVLARLDAWRPQ